MNRKTSRAVRYASIVLLVFAMITGIPMCILGLKLRGEEPLLSYCVIGLGLIVIIGFVGNFIKERLTNIICGRYTFDEEKLVFRCPSHTIEFRYDECAEAGFTRWFAGSPRATFPQFMYFVYLSKKELTETQRANLLRYHQTGLHKRKRKKEDIPVFESEYILFQYSPKAFEEFIKCVPDRIRHELEKQEKDIVLTRYEERVNRDDHRANADEKDQSNQPKDIDKEKTIASRPLARKTKIAYSKSGSYKTSITIRVMHILRIMFTSVYWTGLTAELLGDVSHIYSSASSIVLEVVCHVWGTYSSMLLLWNKITQPLLNRVFFNEEGVYFKMPFRTIGVRFDECKNIRIIRWKGKREIIHFICLSSSELPDGEDQDIYRIRKTKKKRKLEYMRDYVLFEYYTGEMNCYKPEIFDTFMKYVPEQYKEQLLQDEKELIIPFLEQH